MVIGFSALAPAAAQADETERCIAAHVEGQRLRRDGKLRAARDAFVACSKPSCPGVLIEECGGLLAGVEAAVPTVVFEASDDEGNDVADARVVAGGRILASRFDGKGIEIDPGEYKLRFERSGAKPIEQTIVIREGDKARKIAVQFQPAEAPETKRTISPAVWATGGVGLLGLGLFAGLAGAGFAKRTDLDDSGCKPHCNPDDVDTIRSLFLGADISLGIGAASLALAPILYFALPAQVDADTSQAAWFGSFGPSGVTVGVVF